MAFISIQPAQLSELSTLARIGRKTFTQTFASSNDATDFATYLDEAFAEVRLSQEMSNPEASFFFAKVDGEVVGYLKTNQGSAQTEKIEGRTLEIERIYVDVEIQGSGVGKALFQRALEQARAIGADAVWLGVWEDNPKAIEFYSRQGFEKFGEHQFWIGNGRQRDVLMRLEL